MICRIACPDFATTGCYQPEWLEKIEPSDFSLEGYEHHAADDGADGGLSTFA